MTFVFLGFNSQEINDNSTITASKKISFCLCPDFWVDFQMPLLKIPMPKQKYGGGGIILIVFTESSSLSCGISHLHSPVPSLCFLKHPLSMLLIEVEVAYFYYHASAMLWKLTEYLAHSSSSTRDTELSHITKVWKSTTSELMQWLDATFKDLFCFFHFVNSMCWNIIPHGYRMTTTSAPHITTF